MTDRTEAYRLTLAGLREELAELDARRPKLVVSIETLADLIGEPVAIPAPTANPTPTTTVTVSPTSVVPIAPATKPQMTIHEASLAVLREAGRHMRALPITEAIVSKGMIETNSVADLRASVGGILARKAKRKDTFTKPVKGLFGLIEWDGHGPNETDDEFTDALFAGVVDEDEDDEDEAATQDDESQVAA